MSRFTWLTALTLVVGCQNPSLTGVESNTSLLTIFSPASTPANVNINPGSDAELGVIFTSDVAGTVNGVHFYKGSGDTGTHTGHLWTSSGTLLATVIFTGETSSGWQFMAFSSPVNIFAGTRYVVSYHTKTGFSYDPHYFDSQVDAPPLHVPASGGVYTYGTDPVFPTSVFLNSNFWVDVDFTAGAAGGGTTTLFDNTQTPATEDNAGGAIELGVKFTTETTGTLDKLRFYKTANDTGTHVGHLWDQYGTLLTTVTFTNETPTGWQEAAVSVPVAPGQTYTASYSTTTSFGFDNNFFASGIDRAPLHAPVDAGVYGASGSFPQGNYFGDNFWVDVEFTAGACAPSCTACGVSDGCGTICCSAPQYNIWSVFEGPSAGQPGGSEFELGTQFVTATSGSITHLRFYKMPGDGGSHAGHLWNSSGGLLGTVTFPAGGTGWQDQPLSSPVAVAPGQTYVVSYHSTTGFAATANYFTSPRSVLPLTVPVNGGVYGMGPGAVFPTIVLQANNFWADVTFAPAAKPASLFGSTSLPGFDQNGAGMPFELGVQFTSSSAGAITKLRFYKGAGNSGPHVGNLWDTSMTLLATAPYTNESASGWQEVTLPSPVPIAADTTYVASYGSTTGFAADQGWFGPGFDRPPLHVPAQGGVFSNTVGVFPSQTFNGTNYWVDFVLQPLQMGQSCVPSCSGVTCGGSDGCGGTCCSGSGCTPITTCDPQCQTLDTCGSGCVAVTDETSCTVGGVGGSCQAGSCVQGGPHSVFNLMGSGTDYISSSFAYELGMIFTSDTAGVATKIRFLKPAGANSNNVGHLWDGAGNLLATAPFTNETASGWQEVTLATPVSISAATNYMVSYSTDSGLTYTNVYFNTPRDVPPLHVPVGGGLWSASGTFPNQNWANSNFWVDVVVVN